MAGRNTHWPAAAGTVAGLAGVAGAVFFGVLPGLTDRRLNRVVGPALPPVSPQAQTLHDTLLVADLHADTLMWERDLLTRSAHGHVDLPRLREGNVALQVFSSVTKTPTRPGYHDNVEDDADGITLLTLAQLRPPRTWVSLLQRSLHQARALQDAADRSRGTLVTVRSKGDLDALVAARTAGQDVTGALFAAEGLHNLEGEFDNLAVLHAAGLRMAGFAHFHDTEVAGSMHGVRRGGLTDLGRRVFDAMQATGIAVDLAHASHDAVADMLERATKPLVFSHGGVQGTCEVNRNLTNDEVRGVAATGGVVGIGYWAEAIGERTPAAVVDAIEYVIDIGGVATAALGSDFDGATTLGWDTSKLAVLTDELLRRGHSETDIAAIMGGNTIRVLRETLPD